MSMDWLKLYSEARNDAKLRSLTDAQHRVWFNLLCFAGEQEARGTIPPMPARLLAAEVASADASLLAETLDALSELQIITVVDGVISFRAWGKRQRRKPSDEPEAVAARVAKHRQGQRETPASNDVTPCNAPVTPCSENVTPPDIEIEREYISTSQVPISENRGVQGGRDKRANAAASRGSRLPDGFAPSDADTEWAGREYPDVDTAAQTAAFCDYWRSKAGADARKLDWQATWRNWIRRAAEYSARRQSPTPSRASPPAPFPPRETAFQAARRRNLEIIAEWGAEMDAAIDEQEQRLQEQMAAQSRQEQSHGHDEPTDTTPFRADNYGIIIPAPARAGRSADLIAGRDGLRRAGATLERLGYAGARGFDA